MAHSIITNDLGYGDSGKGSIVDALCRKYNVNSIIRFSGGAQCGHNVVLPDNTHHTFRQFGSGTFSGAYTILSSHVIIDPVALINEAIELKEKGINYPESMVCVDENALVATPYHKALNRATEAARRYKRHGSCGYGVGETVLYALKSPDKALRVGDLKDSDKTRDKLFEIKQDLAVELVHRFHQGSEYSKTFDDENLIDAMLWRYQIFRERIAITSTDYILSRIKSENCVFEASQGILLDEDVGFHPYTTWSRTRLTNALQLCWDAGISNFETLAIIRAYACRHGPGPFPTEAAELDNLRLVETYNKFNRWQRNFRVGWFDMVAAHYAVEQAGGAFNSLAITHVDSLATRPDWEIGIDYLLERNPPDDLESRKNATEKINRLNADDIETIKIQANNVVGFISENLKIPVSISSSGPTHKHKSFAKNFAFST